MATIEITTEIRANMNITLDTLRQVVDKDGYFEFDDLRATGLKRVEVMQAIALLNKEGQSIKQERVTLFGGCTMYQWRWYNIRENRARVQVTR